MLPQPPNNQGSPQGQSGDIFSLSYRQTKQEELKQLTRQVIKLYSAQHKSILARLQLWIFITLLLITTLAIFYIYLFGINFPDKWTWQILYETAIRISFLSLFASLIIYCLKMVRSYLHLYENAKHKKLLLSSMPYLVTAKGDPDQINITYNKILEILINLGNTGIITIESESSEGGKEYMPILLEILKKLGEK